MNSEKPGNDTTEESAVRAEEADKVAELALFFSTANKHSGTERYQQGVADAVRDMQAACLLGGDNLSKAREFARVLAAAALHDHGHGAYGFGYRSVYHPALLQIGEVGTGKSS